MGTIRLDEQEQKELADHPISPTFKLESEEQFELRLRIAQKMCRFFLEADKTVTPEHRAIYEAYPMWGFYTNHEGSCPRRIYGVCTVIDTNTGERVPSLHAVTAHLFWNNDVVGGVAARDVVRVERWNDANLSIIDTCGAPGAFRDPLGFMLVLEEHALKRIETRKVAQIVESIYKST